MIEYLILIKTLVAVEYTSLEHVDGYSGKTSNVDLVRGKAGGVITRDVVKQHDVGEMKITVILMITGDQRKYFHHDIINHYHHWGGMRSSPCRKSPWDCMKRRREWNNTADYYQRGASLGNHHAVG